MKHRIWVSTRGMSPYSYIEVSTISEQVQCPHTPQRYNKEPQRERDSALKWNGIVFHILTDSRLIHYQKLRHSSCVMHSATKG